MLLLATLCTAATALAYDFQSGDLYYNITSDTTVEVTYQRHWGATNYQGLTTAIIPETVTYNGTTYSVTSIGERAFEYCSSLTSVTIPNSVTSIGYSAFYDCSSLIDIYCYATTPPVCVEDTDYSSFVGVSKHSYIHVPAGTIPDYQLATGWRYFSNFLEISEETAISETEQ